MKYWINKTGGFKMQDLKIYSDDKEVGNLKIDYFDTDIEQLNVLSLTADFAWSIINEKDYFLRIDKADISIPVVEFAEKCRPAKINGKELFIYSFEKKLPVIKSDLDLVVEKQINRGEPVNWDDFDYIGAEILAQQTEA